MYAIRSYYALDPVGRDPGDLDQVHGHRLARALGRQAAQVLDDVAHPLGAVACARYGAA